MPGSIGGTAYYGGQAQPGAASGGAAQGSSYPGYPAAAMYGGQPGGGES